MRLSETRDLFISELAFPVERQSVIDQLGDNQIDPPTGEAETIGEIIERSDADSFRTPDELYDTLVSFVGEQYVGRKFYDDRGPNTAIDSEEVSF